MKNTIVERIKGAIDKLPKSDQDKLLGGDFGDKFGLGGLKHIRDRLRQPKGLGQFKDPVLIKELDDLFKELEDVGYLKK